MRIGLAENGTFKKLPNLKHVWEITSTTTSIEAAAN